MTNVAAAADRASLPGLLEGRAIIVTGAASGIGMHTATLLARSGARLLLADRSEGGEEVADRIRAEGGAAQFLLTDIGDEADVVRLVDEAKRIYGRLDGAFNNAGIAQVSAPLHEMTMRDWDRAIRIDLTGVFLCLKFQIPAMIDTGGGAIVNTASGLGQVAIPNASEYIAAKHGVVGLTRAAAVEYGTRGIRVNAVLPGIIETPMVADLAADPGMAAAIPHLRARHALGRFGQPVEIGQAVRWLLSDEASFVSGAMIAVDGGYLAS